MRFYNRQHRHYCGIDLHVKTMCVCILDGTGQVLVYRHVPSTPQAFLEMVTWYRDDLVVAAACMFTWYFSMRVTTSRASIAFRRSPPTRGWSRAHQSAGKTYGTGGAKMGNVHLKWAFSEAAVLFLRQAPGGKKLLGEMATKHGKGKALSILARWTASARRSRAGAGRARRRTRATSGPSPSRSHCLRTRRASRRSIASQRSGRARAMMGRPFPAQPRVLWMRCPSPEPGSPHPHRRGHLRWKRRRH